MLNTERLSLRPASREETEALIAAQEEPGLRAAYREMLDGCLAHPEQWLWYAPWLIALQDGTCIGDVCFKGLAGDGAVEIGYGINAPHEGQGYATEAVDAMVRWALRQPGVTRVEAETEPGNAASQRVLAKCGFTPTGTLGTEGPRFVRLP
ncbi:MAG: GNAT family N-acetyltransferase [Aristaeellaceae bacterium]